MSQLQRYANYQRAVAQGQLPAGIEDEMEAFGVYLVTESHGSMKDIAYFAEKIAESCF